MLCCTKFSTPTYYCDYFRETFYKKDHSRPLFPYTKQKEETMVGPFYFKNKWRQWVTVLCRHLQRHQNYLTISLFLSLSLSLSVLLLHFQFQSFQLLILFAKKDLPKFNFCQSAVHPLWLRRKSISRNGNIDAMFMLGPIHSQAIFPHVQMVITSPRGWFQ